MPAKGQFQKHVKAESLRKREYNARPEQKKNRAARNKLRREGLREGRVHKGDGKDIDHKTPLAYGGSKGKSNTRVISRHANRKSGGRIGGLR